MQQLFTTSGNAIVPQKKLHDRVIPAARGHRKRLVGRHLKSSVNGVSVGTWRLTPSYENGILSFPEQATTAVRALSEHRKPHLRPPTESEQAIPTQLVLRKRHLHVRRLILHVVHCSQFTPSLTYRAPAAVLSANTTTNRMSLARSSVVVTVPCCTVRERDYRTTASMQQ